MHTVTCEMMYKRGVERKRKSKSAVPGERQGVVPLPGRASGCMVVTVALAQSAVLLSDGSKTTSLATLVDGFGDPVDPRITTNGLVVGVHENDFKVLVDTILVDPVRVEDSQVSTSATNTLLSSRPQSTLGLELVDTLAHRLAVGGTLGDGLFAVTAANAHTVDNISLLGLVAETAGLVRARWARGAVDNIQLSVLPAPNTEKESKDIRLFLFVQLSNILVCAHLAPVLKIGRAHV